MRASPPRPDAGVSEREAEVLALVGDHLTNAQIAGRLYLSVRTVESHVSSLLRKLGVADRRALAALAGAPAAAARSDGLPAASLPTPLTSFVGRAAEREALAGALTEHRLVTTVGPGGVGKTRLALAVAEDVRSRHTGGARYVDLVPVTDPAMVGAALAGAFGFGEQPGRSPADTVVAKLAGADVLLVLDNCEHLLDGVSALVERLLAACPRVVVLATSRARLRLPFEFVFPVPGMSLEGDAGSDADQSDATALFHERASMTGWTSPYPDDRPADRDRLPPARRDGAGDRAGSRPGGDPWPRRAGPGAGRPAGSADGWVPDGPAAPVAARRARLELRPALDRRAGGHPASVGVRQPVHRRSGGGLSRASRRSRPPRCRTPSPAWPSTTWWWWSTDHPAPATGCSRRSGSTAPS